MLTDSWVGDWARQAPSEEAATKVVREQLRNSGGCGPERGAQLRYAYRGGPKGMWCERGGREGWLRWREFAWYVRSVPAAEVRHHSSVESRAPWTMQLTEGHWARPYWQAKCSTCAWRSRWMGMERASTASAEHRRYAVGLSRKPVVVRRPRSEAARLAAQLDEASTRLIKQLERALAENISLREETEKLQRRLVQLEGLKMVQLDLFETVEAA